MKYLFWLSAISLICSYTHAQEKKSTDVDPWTGKYPMSFITKTRTANVVGKDRLCVAIKWQSVNCDEMLVNDRYQDLTDTNKFDQYKAVFTTKYGWAKNHHVALGIPYLWTDFESSKANIHSNGIGNVFIFEKWKFIDETKTCPAFAMDVWYYFDTGDTQKKLGSEDDSTKLSMQISKAWRHFSLHLNPAYRWNLHDGIDIGELNIGSYFNVNKSTKLALEYNFTGKESKGKCHDLVPGILWKPSKTSSIKLGAVINLDSDMKYKDDLGVCLKMFYKF